jgi:hypothetical protein
MTKENDFLAKKLGVYVLLAEPERRYLAELQSRPVHVERGKELVYEGEPG